MIGSAPSINDYKSEIANFKGEIWCLNDSWFWLEPSGIKIDKIFITDSRFIEKSKTKIAKSKPSKIFTLDTVNIDPIYSKNHQIVKLKNLGRDGFSMRAGEIYHGCSVFFAAIQVAASSGIKDISCCGVLFPPPGKYKRIDKSMNMPEYIYPFQLLNAKKMMGKLSELEITLNIFEPESNLHFL